jgi:hypothetical protein
MKNMEGSLEQIASQTTFSGGAIRRLPSVASVEREVPRVTVW